MDPDLIHTIWHDLKLDLKKAALIRDKGCVGAKIKGISNFKDLYKIYARHQKLIWDAGTEQAEETITLPDESGGYGFGPKKKGMPKRANILHFIASFNGVDQIKQLSDIGSMLASWAIEEACFWVLEDEAENKEDHENAQFGDLWIPPPEIEDVPNVYNYDEATLIAKLNKRLEG